MTIDNRGATMHRILVAEDEMVVAMLLQDRMELAGYEVLMVARLDQGLALAQSEKFDAAILDVNLAGETSFPLADALCRRGVPVLFATGYGLAGLPDDYREHAVLQKPYDMDTLNAALAGLIGSVDNGPSGAAPSVPA